MKIGSLKFDPRNANRGTERGRKALASSLEQFGAGRSILVDKNGVVIAGNKTLAQAIARGDKDVTVVKTDGSKIIAVQRTDLDLRDAKAKGLAVADNRVAELDLEWDEDALAAIGRDVDLSAFFEPEESKAVSFTAKDGVAMDMNYTYSVIVDCTNETDQIKLLEKLEKQKYKCRLLIS
jgi:ParB-like chromosome segregation protein Spo0J